MEVRNWVIDVSGVGQSPPRRGLAISTYPAPDAKAVYRDVVVKASWSEPIAGLDAATFTLRDSRGALVPATVDQIGDGTWALFPDRVFLKPEEVYTARIGGRLCAFDGRCEVLRRAWQFTTTSSDGPGKGDTRVPAGFVGRERSIDAAPVSK
jgi:hypothetical protein